MRRRMNMNQKRNHEYSAIDFSRRCFYYMNVGACKYGNRCTQVHPYIRSGSTLLLSHIYQPPPVNLNHPQQHLIIQQHFQEFYQDLYAKLSQYGDIKVLIVCDNRYQCIYMAGNAYVRYRTKKHASIALDNLRGTSSFAGRPIIVQFSPARHFKRYSCREYQAKNTCSNGKDRCYYFHRMKLISNNTTKQVCGDGLAKYSE